MKLSKVLEAIKEELKKSLPEPRVVQTKKERKMAKKAKKQDEDERDDEEDEADEADESEDEEEEEAPKSKKKGKKGGKKAKAKEDDGYVSIGDLAEEAGIEAQSARVKLRESDLGKPEGGRWRWKDGSKDLKAARKALGL